MKRMRLLLGMLAMAALMAGTVAFLSPYAPVVGPVPQIEAIWAMEDARRESGTPLITCLENGGMRLGYDAQENTFYCPIGLENGETWPELHLTAPGAGRARLCFADDYAYDWCDEAVREGYAYQILVCTEAQYAYTQVVFTGLPVVCLTTDAEITLDEQPGFAAISAPGYGPIQADARIGLRGAATVEDPKRAYKVEFAGSRHGGRMAYDLPGIGMESELALLPMGTDETMMREKLSWELYAALEGADEPFGARQTQHVELFVNDEYVGVYLMMNLMDAQRELGLAGERHLRDDSVYRSTYLPTARDRSTIEDPLMGPFEFGYELRYSARPGREFDDLQPYLALLTADDEAFAAHVPEILDLDQVLRYDLFVQACGLNDNTYNNMFIRAQRTAQGMRYSLHPWDLDLSWGTRTDHIGEGYDWWMRFPLVDRILDLDVGGARARLAQLWQQMRETLLTPEKVARMMDAYILELTESGAARRNELRWEMGMSYPDGQEIMDFACTRLAVMDEIVARIAGADGRLPFLTADCSESSGIAVFGGQEGRE